MLDKRDSLVLTGILVGVGIPVVLMFQEMMPHFLEFLYI